jgi:heat-inducible transcriptional repressor
MELDERKKHILRAVVTDYVQTAEPVGSHGLIERHGLGVKSATVRNELAELSELGYLRQPHTSAGRVPAVRGYRYFVNFLMAPAPLAEREGRGLELSLRGAATALETTLRHTCQLLAELTQLPAVATAPESNATTLRKIFLTAAGPNLALLVFLFSDGRTENRLLPEVSLSASQALILADALQDRFGDRRLRELADARMASAQPPPGHPALISAWRRLCAELQSAVASVEQRASVFVEGAQTALRQPEFRDVERLEQFLTVIQERAAVVELVGQALERSPSSVSVRIGDELGRPELSEYAVVCSPYFVGETLSGTIGVVGPTRLDYARASAAVRFMANAVGVALTRLSVA